MLDWSGIRDRLTPALAPTPVAGAAEFAAIMETSLTRAPLVWVVPLRETADANALAGGAGIHQLIGVYFGVVYAVRQVQDATGAAASASLTGLRSAAFATLLDWTPPLAADAPAANPEPLVYASGGLLRFADGLLFWQDQFLARYTLRVV